MTDQTLKTRMGTRLTALFSAVPETTSEFWDLCCDHGAIGRAMLESRRPCPVVFNDIHNDIMANLQHQLTALQAEDYRLYYGPAEQIVLTESPRPTLMLAGVGAEQCITILTHLFAQPASASAIFIISAATKMHRVRQFLIDQGVFLVHESVVTENKRAYEILSVGRDSFSGGKKMSARASDLFGACWQPDNPDHRRHLDKLIGFYQAKSQHLPAGNIDATVQGYKDILKNYHAKT
ncbi:SAM-dependent methyltransferase [Reinekea sp.]|jgi:tRNA (adenine22-N1)-methyltransferase|uniref:SAM-dependent methyltransferase n=1 Tax=Reinekea sp. TaxID=1970455 RepID=UPI002A83C347|nr:SAM-dependent methyltransferase [Reinekea sp.]